jgi:hypothetical protein
MFCQILIVTQGKMTPKGQLGVVSCQASALTQTFRPCLKVKYKIDQHKTIRVESSN